MQQQAERLGGVRYARGWSIDVRDLNGLEQVMREVAEHFGAIDVVVAGAGVLGALETIEVATAATWDRVIDINLNGAGRTMKAAAPHVVASQGHVVAVSSLIAYVHPPLLASYAASKAGVAALCDVLRLEMRARGVTVGSVHPAIFRTPMIGEALSSPAATELVNDFTGVFQDRAAGDGGRRDRRGIERRARARSSRAGIGLPPWCPASSRPSSNDSRSGPRRSPAPSNWNPPSRRRQHLRRPPTRAVQAR